MYDIIICDFDGTLFDTLELNYLAYALAFGDSGYKLDREQYVKCFGLKFDALCDTLHIPKSQVIRGDLHLRKKIKYLELCQRKYLTKINNDLIKRIEQYKQENPKCKLVIGTCASRDCVCELLKTYDILNLFDDIFCGEDVKHSKPNPEIYDLICDKYNITTNSTGIIFEDSDIGIEAAENCKAKLQVERIHI